MIPNLIVVDLELAVLPVGRVDATKLPVSVLVGWGLRDLTPNVWILDSTRFPRVLMAEKNLVDTFNKYDGIVGWNSIAFDEPTMKHRIPDLSKFFRGRKHVDLHAICCLISAGVSISRIEEGVPQGWGKLVPTIRADLLSTGWGLDSVGQGTLKIGKTEGPHGADAVKYWQEGVYSPVITYCVGDVGLTRELYLHAWKSGNLTSTERGAVQIPRSVL